MFIVFIAVVLVDLISCQENTQYITSGSNVTLSCSADENVEWDYASFDGSYYKRISIGLKMIDKNPRLSVFYIVEDYISLLNIAEFDLSVDPGRYICRPATREITFSVYAAEVPSSIEFTVDGANYANGSTITVVENIPIVLSCEAIGGNPVPDVILTTGSEVLENTTGVVFRMFTPSRNSFSQSIYCLVANQAMEEAIMVHVQLNVIVTPSSPYLQFPEMVNEGDDAVFTCSTSGGYPAPKIKWTFDGSSNMSITTNPPVHDTATDSFTVTSLMTLREVTSRDDQKNVTCNVEHDSLDNRLTTTTLLSVYYIPHSGPTISGYSSESVLDESSRFLQLTCSTDGGNPLPQLQWSCPGIYTSRYSQDLILPSLSLEIVVSKDINNKTCTCDASQEGTSWAESTSVTFTVYYAPDSGPTISGYVSGNALVEGGESLTLTCSTEGGTPLPELEWTCPGSVVPLDTPVPNISSLRQSIDISRAINNETCQCTATQSGYNWSNTDFVDFLVHFGPDNVSLDIIGDMIESNTVTFSCTTAETNIVDIGFTWFEESNQIYGVYTSTRLPQRGPNYGFYSVSNWSKILQQSDDGKEISCSTQNINGEIVTNTVHLEIHYAVRETKIIMEPNICIEFELLTVTCSSVGKPEPTYTLTTPTGATVTSHISHIPLVSRLDAGTYICRAENKYGSESVNKSIIVQYPPAVSIVFPKLVAIENETDFKLLCTAEGVPNSPNFQLWKHFGPDGKTEIRTLRGESLGIQSHITLPGDVSYEDTGYYECSVENGIYDATGKLYQKTRSFLDVKGSPIIPEQLGLVSAALGESVTLNIDFYSNPFDSVTWYKNNTENEFGRTVVHFEQTTSIRTKYIRLPFYGKEVDIEGHSSSLLIESTTTKNYGTYWIEVTNEFGSQILVLELRQTSSNVSGQSGDETGVIVGAVMGVLIVAVLCAIVIIIWRKGILSKVIQSKKKRRTNSNLYVNQAFDTANNSSRPNDGIYQDLAPSDNPNENYASLNNSRQTNYTALNNSSQTKKSNNTGASMAEGDEIPVYLELINSSTDNSNPDGAYSLARFNVESAPPK